MDLPFDVVEFGDADHPVAGDTAPDFTRPLVTDEYWEDTALSDLTREGPVLLCFHPMDGAFPATYIWNELRNRDFGEIDASVVGLSISTPYAHKAFISERSIEEFRFFSDPANDVAEQYDLVHDLDGMAGVAEPRPATFVIDEDRTVTYAWVADEWPEFPEYDELEAELTAVL